LIALRMPFVFEEIGGKPDDWDAELFKNFNPKALIAIVCQVKGGAIGDKPLFREPYLSYSIKRIGLTSNIDSVIEQLNKSAIASFKNDLGQDCQIAKLLITR